MDNLFFTIFTPTYNRQALLHRAYESICRQNTQNFEWVIVDDGSTDDTRALIESWQKTATFSIIYYYQQNSGRHVAINRGIELANGEFFIILDSDDWLTDRSLELTAAAWKSLPDSKKENCSGIWGLCAYVDGAIAGSKFPSDIFVSNTIEINTIYNVSGDKCHAIRTEIRKKFMFPESDEKYCMPSLVWNRIGQHYTTLFINDVLQFIEYQVGGLSKAGKTKLWKYPQNYRLRSKEYVAIKNRVILPKDRKDAMKMYIRASFHAKVGLFRQFLEISDKVLWCKSLRKGRRKYLKDLEMTRVETL